MQQNTIEQRPLTRFLKVREILALANIGRTSLWRLVKAGKFPEPARVGPNSVRWKLSDYEAWRPTPNHGKTTQKNNKKNGQPVQRSAVLSAPRRAKNEKKLYIKSHLLKTPVLFLRRIPEPTSTKTQRSRCLPAVLRRPPPV